MWISSGPQQAWDFVTRPVGQTEGALLLPMGKGADVSMTWNGNAATFDCVAANTASVSPAGASASLTPSATASPSMSFSAGQA